VNCDVNPSTVTCFFPPGSTGPFIGRGNLKPEAKCLLRHAFQASGSVSSWLESITEIWIVWNVKMLVCPKVVDTGYRFHGLFDGKKRMINITHRMERSSRFSGHIGWASWPIAVQHRPLPEKHAHLQTGPPGWYILGLASWCGRNWVPKQWIRMQIKTSNGDMIWIIDYDLHWSLVLYSTLTVSFLLLWRKFKPETISNFGWDRGVRHPSIGNFRTAQKMAMDNLSMVTKKDDVINLPLVWKWTYFLHLCLGCQTKQGSQWKVNGSSQLRSLSSRDLHLATAKALCKFSCGKEIISKSCPFSEVTSGYGSNPGTRMVP